jgi:primosomal protein N' (replication factor Y)
MNKPREDVRKRAQKEPFRVIAPELEKRIQTLQKKRVPVVLIAVRRGYAPVSICRDCETTVTDSEGRPLILYTNTKGERAFRDTNGKVHKDADISCSTCGGWNILPLGIGIERVRDTLAELFPRAPIACFSSVNETATPKLLEDALRAGSLIVGSEAILALLPKNIKEIAIVSADSLLALPFYRARERFLRLVLLARERSEQVTVQTRKADTVKKMMDTQSFFKEEHALRTQFRYPPEWRLILIVAEGALVREKTVMETVRERCAPWSEDVLTKRTSEGKTTLSLLLRIKAEIWPEQNIVTLLQSLPPSFRILIDPESIL